jgi:hypothetical protein
MKRMKLFLWNIKIRILNRVNGIEVIEFDICNGQNDKGSRNKNVRDVVSVGNSCFVSRAVAVCWHSTGSLLFPVFMFMVHIVISWVMTALGRF